MRTCTLGADTVHCRVDNVQVISLPDVPNGAGWRCVDLHLHTPGVHTFAMPDGVDEHNPAQRARVAEKYAERLKAAGIDIAAITDYQGVRVEWFSDIRERTADVTVLPGAEMSVDVGEGVHLLLVCDEDTDPEWITDVIRHQGKDSWHLFSGRKPHAELELRESLEKTLQAMRKELGCVVIAAHAEDDKGLLKMYGAEKTARLIRDGLLDALDHCEGARTRLQGTGILTPEQLDSLACTLSSDPRSLEEVGAKTTADGRPRLTWVKLSAVDTSALRLALHDPQTRVLTSRPEPPHHPQILSMEVQGGFLDGLALRFNDDLTTLIGGRGAGKSAVLETLRYALDGMPYSDQSERMSLVRHAIGSGGRVRLVVERPGQQQQCYEITRVLDQEAQVTDLSRGTTLGVSPLEIFGAGGSPVILLQREIQAVTRDDSFRRRLLDEIIGDEARQADSAVRHSEEALRRNQRSMEDLERQLDQRQERTERLARLDSEIAYFEQQGVADKLGRQARAGSDRTRVETAARQMDEVLTTHTDMTGQITEALTVGASELRARRSEHGRLLDDLAGEFDATRARLSDALGRVGADLGALRVRIGDLLTRWPELMEKLDEDLRRIQAELGSDHLDASRYLEAVEERTALRPIVDAHHRQDEELARLQTDRREMLRRLQEQRREALMLRRRAAEKVNHQLRGTLEMSVTYLGDTAEFVNQLGAILRGSRVTADAVGTIATHPATDGVELSQLVEQGEHALADRLGISTTMAQRLVRWLTDEPSRLRQIEVLAPQDRVSIALVIDGKPRDLAQLSSGQKATALLLLVFAQGGRPLILDQPEDDLDNRFVYEDVVSLLRAEKGVTDPERRRQIIAATHNANIPVNGDAELVLSLADDDGRCAVQTRASIDDRRVREEIRTVLEGGADAFRRRAQKYGGLDDA
jgi:DNA repair ATPase RecN